MKKMQAKKMTTRSRKGAAAVASFRPEWKGPIEGFVVNTIKRNFWRLKKSYQFEDLFQEAYLLFLELEKRYSGKVDNPRWFMSLYSRSLINRITDFANETTKLQAETALSEAVPKTNGKEKIAKEDARDMIPGELRNEGELISLLDSAPGEIASVLNVLLGAPTEFLELLTASWRVQRRKNECGNKFLCALVGYNPKHIDIESQIKEYLSEAA